MLSNVAALAGEGDVERMEGMIQMAVSREVVFTRESRPLQIRRILHERANNTYSPKAERRVHFERAVRVGFEAGKRYPAVETSLPQRGLAG